MKPYFKAAQKIARKAVFAVLCGMIMAVGIIMPCKAETPALTTVRISCGINRALYLDEDGNPQGCCSDYLLALADINGWQYEYVEGDWPESVQRLNNGEIDILFPTQITPERLETMQFSTLAGGYQTVALCVGKDADFCYEDFAGFDGARIAVTKNSYNHMALRQYAKEHQFLFEPVFIDKSEDKVGALQNGDVDMIVFSTFNDMPSCKMVGTLDVQPFYYAVSAENTALLAQLNNGMQELLVQNPGLVSSTEKACMGIERKSSPWAFTREEADFIKSGRKIVVGFYVDATPLANVESDGSYSGIYIDIIKQLQQISGLEIELYPIDRSLYAFDLLDGTIDFFIGANSALVGGESEKDLIRTESIMDYYTVAITASDYQFTEDSAPCFALTSARHYWNDDIKSQYPGATIQYYKSAKDCLLAVNRGEADATLLNTNEFNYQSKNPRFSNLIEWESFRTLSHMVMVASADADSQMLSTMNKAILQLSTESVQSIISYHLNTPYHSASPGDILYNIRIPLIASIAILVVCAMAVGCIFHIRNKSYTALEQKNRQLEKANSIQTDFLSRMSHDLRTPLNEIIGASLLAQDENKAPAVQEYLTEINRSAQFMLGLVGDILSLNCIERGRIVLHPQPYTQDEFMRDIEAMFRFPCEKKNIELLMHSGEGSKTIYVDKLRLKQIFFNLLSNAVKYTPAGGKVEYIIQKRAVERNRLSVIFIVRDNGIGMSEEYQKHMYEMFSREETGNTAGTEGSGIGLSIAQNLVRLMGGTIECQSTLGIGTTFTVYLTFDLADDKAPVPETVPADLTVLSGKRILLVEDHDINAMIATKLLLKKGMEADRAENGKIAVEKFKNAEAGYYDAILMDIRMPVMDGLEATKAIRSLSHSDAGSIPIIAMTANAYESDRENSRAAGMNEHLAKPIDPQLLYAALAEQIGHQ